MVVEQLKAVAKISTLAPREGSDTDRFERLRDQGDFNPRSPRGERRGGFDEQGRLQDFNPRSPRGERLPIAVTKARFDDFNPRSPRGERRLCGESHRRASGISTLAPREGSDT